MAEQRRWTLYEGVDGAADYVAGPPFEDGVEVMPVSEHARLWGAAQAVIAAYDHFPTKGWRELAALKSASTCEVCERKLMGDFTGWVIGAEGEDFCPECTYSLVGGERDHLRALLAEALPVLNRVRQIIGNNDPGWTGRCGHYHLVAAYAEGLHERIVEALDEARER